MFGASRKMENPEIFARAVIKLFSLKNR